MSGPDARRILLVDCDSFYVQVARLEDPLGAGREPLLIVGGSPDGRGVVTSASYEARRFGVRSAMSTAEALRLCPDAVVVPVPRQACSSKSRAILTVLDTLSPRVQPASIDEFYLDLTGTERLFRGETLEASAGRIQARVLQETNVQVSIGGGTRRMIAKLAAGRAKPAGVRVVPPGQEALFMKELQLEDIPGVGPTLQAELAQRGLVSVEDALRVGDEWLIRWFGDGRGRWLAERIRGVDSSDVNPHEPRKSLSSENTFFRDIDDDGEVERELLRLVGSVASSLRSEELRARTVTVKIRDDDFTTRQAGHTLPDAVESDRAIYEVARGLLSELRKKRRRPVRLLGVGLSGLTQSDTPRQLGFFEEAIETERDRVLARVRDDISSRFGREGIVPARLVGSPKGFAKEE
jgi:DNA polymerase-4